MNFLKLFLISAVVLFLLLTGIAFLLPSQVRISRAINISASPLNIQSLVWRLPHWQQWNEYVKTLPDKNLAPDSITSPNLNIYITKTDNNSLQTAWRQKNGKSFWSVINLIPSQSVTTVQWYFEFTFKWYPWEKFSSIIYDKQLGPQMEQSLFTLKQLIEEAP